MRIGVPAKGTKADDEAGPESSGQVTSPPPAAPAAAMPLLAGCMTAFGWVSLAPPVVAARDRGQTPSAS